MKRLVFAVTLLSLWSCDSTLIMNRAFIGPGGGSVEGPDNTSIIIPENALSADVEIYVLPNDSAVDTPPGTQRVYDTGAKGISLKEPAVFTVPKGVCYPKWWSLNGTAPWLKLPQDIKNCPKDRVCSKISVLGSIACTKGGWDEDR